MNRERYGVVGVLEMLFVRPSELANVMVGSQLLQNGVLLPI